MPKGIFETFFEDMKQQIAAVYRIPPRRLGLTMPELPGPQLLLPEHCVGDCIICGEDQEVVGSYGEELWPCPYCVTKEVKLVLTEHGFDTFGHLPIVNSRSRP